MNLGDMIDTLALFPPDAEVWMEGGAEVPVRVAPHGGLSSTLAIEVEFGARPLSVAQFLTMCRELDGKLWSSPGGGSGFTSRLTDLYVHLEGKMTDPRPVGLFLRDAKFAVIAVGRGAQTERA